MTKNGKSLIDSLDFDTLADLRQRLETLVELSIPEKFQPGDGSSEKPDDAEYLYNSNWHMIHVGIVARQLADLFSLEKKQKELIHICGLIHDVGYFEPESFLDVEPGSRVKYVSAASEMKNEKKAIENILKNPSSCLDCKNRTKDELSELIFHIVSEGSELLKKIMFEISLPEYTPKTNVQKYILIMALADGLQFAHPGYIYFIPRLARQSGGTGHFGVPSDYVDILRECTVDNIVAAMEFYCPQFVGTDGMTTLLKNQEIVHAFLSGCEGMGDEECRALGGKLMSICEEVWPQIKDTPSFSPDVPEDFPERVLKRFELRN